MARQFHLINYNFLKKDASNEAFGKKEIDSMIQFAIKNNLNPQQGFIFNVGQHSGSYRFFLVDFDTRKVLVEGLCCHGSGSATFDENPEISNVIGGNCSSVGFYKIGYKYNGKFGDAYKLYGLSPTNNNAFDRFVVLHAHDCVPEQSVPVSICQSLGCPTLSPGIFKKIATYIDKSEKPMLLYLFKGKGVL